MLKPQSAWGRLSALPHQIVPLTRPLGVLATLQASKPGVAFGNGRSYGDSCLNPGGVLWATRGLDHFIAFNPESGVLTCEAGVLLKDIQALVVPLGWMLPVTPGTQLVTVGGAIANDVHGKNHHVYGSFGDHIQQIKLLRTDGQEILCGPELLSDWFAATLGGIGLTGVVTEATIQLRTIPSAWLETETLAFDELDQFFTLADGSEAQWENTVSWIDCIAGGRSRGLFMRGNFVNDPHLPIPSQRPKKMPCVPPVSLINRLSLRAFNQAYYWLNKQKTGPQLTHYQSFFYPLDNLHDWNKIYGPRGFYQYQCVVPRGVGPDAIAAMLTDIGRSGEGSFLAVLKTFGQRQSKGMLGFAQPGATLALDFTNNGTKTLALFKRLDSIVREACGRIYLAKDARMPRDLFQAGYPRISEFMRYRDHGISSEMSRRLID